MISLYVHSRSIKGCSLITSERSPSCDTAWEERSKSFEQYIKYLEEQEKSREESLSEWNGKRAYDLYEPEWTCDDEKRVGPKDINVGDGPKFVCAPELVKDQGDCLIYSIGSNYDFSFEQGMRRHGPNCQFHTFDGTLNLTTQSLPAGLEEQSIHFHNWNVDLQSGTNEKGWISKTINDILSALGHEGKRIDVFKIDCEGCEYGVMPQVLDLVQSGLIRIDQVQIEIHGTDAAKVQSLFQSFRAAGYAVFHKERNHWGCDGYSCVEYSFISLTRAEQIFIHSHCLEPQLTKDNTLVRADPWWYTPLKKSIVQGPILIKPFPYNISSRNDVGLLQLLCYTGSYKIPSKIIDIGLPGESIYFAEKGHQSVAFEAREEGFKSIKAAIESKGLSDRIKLHHTALSNFTGHMKIYDARDSSSLFKSAVDVGPELKKRSEEGMRETDVHVSTLDAYIDSADAMKIDTQGAEPEIFMGAEKVFTSGMPFPLIMEYCTRLRDFPELEIGLHILRGLGYQCYARQDLTISKDSSFCGDFYCAKSIENNHCF